MSRKLQCKGENRQLDRRDTASKKVLALCGDDDGIALPELLIALMLPILQLWLNDHSERVRVLTAEHRQAQPKKRELQESQNSWLHETGWLLRMLLA